MDKVYLVSYPRSGCTWMRLLLANIQHPEIDCGYHDINKFVPDIHQPQSYKNIKFTWNPVIFKSHFKQFPYYQKVIYLYRDGRDVAISYYHFQSYQGKFKGSFDQFLKQFCKGDLQFGSWKEHLIWWFNSKLDRRYLEYEFLLTNPVEAITNIVDFLGLDINEKIIRQAIERTRYSRLRKEIAPRDGLHPKLLGLKGEAGWRRSIFTDKQKKLFWDWAGDLLTNLGYEEE